MSAVIGPVLAECILALNVALPLMLWRSASGRTPQPPSKKADLLYLAVPGPEFCRFCGLANNSDEAFWCSTRNPGCSDGR